MMAEPLKVGFAGLVHDHVWDELPHWANISGYQLLAAADPNPELIEKIQQRYNIRNFYRCPSEMIADSQLDVLQVCTTNADAAEIVELAAKRKIHCIVEKPMAANLEQATRMWDAAHFNQTELIINWPTWWQPNFRTALQWVEESRLGETFHCRLRLAHPGPEVIGCSPYFRDWLTHPEENGGGVLIDYCSYGIATFLYLFGMPKAVEAKTSNLVKKSLPVEDNASVQLIYENTIAIAEGSWTQNPPYRELEFLGTEGRLWTNRGKLYFDASTATREIPLVEPKEGLRNAPEYLLTSLGSKERIDSMVSKDIGHQTQKVLQMALQSANENRVIQL